MPGASCDLLISALSTILILYRRKIWFLFIWYSISHRTYRSAEMVLVWWAKFSFFFRFCECYQNKKRIQNVSRSVTLLTVRSYRLFLLLWYFLFVWGFKNSLSSKARASTGSPKIGMCFCIFSFQAKTSNKNDLKLQALIGKGQLVLEYTWKIVLDWRHLINYYYFCWKGYNIRCLYNWIGRLSS